MEIEETTGLSLNQCTNIRLFTSFEGGIDAACPKGKTAMVMAFPDLDCGGNPVEAGALPSDGNRGQCKEIAVNTSGGDLLGGESAKFTCV